MNAPRVVNVTRKLLLKDDYELSFPDPNWGTQAHIDAIYELAGVDEFIRRTQIVGISNAKARELKKRFTDDPVMTKTMLTFHSQAAQEQLLAEMCLCRVVDTFLVYLADLLKEIFRERPEMLRSDDKVSMEEILSFSTMEDFIAAQPTHAQLAADLTGADANIEVLKNSTFHEVAGQTFIHGPDQGRMPDLPAFLL